MNRSKYIVGNWKMNKTIAEARQFIVDLSAKLNGIDHVYLAVPFTALQASVEAAGKNKIGIGAQNVSQYSPGPYTGEVSASMIYETGASFTLVGHSERRILFNETNAIVNAKLKSALNAGLKVILCVGESSVERKENHMKEILAQQLKEALDGIEDVRSLLIAYEPIWAIGSGCVATVDQAAEVHSFCREEFAKLYGKEAANNLPLLYGGSVNATNAAALLNNHEIDGVLVGSASLSVESFSAIIWRT